MPVNEAAASRADAVGGFADAVVTEVPPFVGLHADDVRRQSSSSTHERFLFEVAHLREQVEAEIAADGGRHLRDRPRFLRQERQPCRDDD